MRTSNQPQAELVVIESRPSISDRAFGVYRSLTPDCAAAVLQAMDEIQGNVNEAIADRPAAGAFKFSARGAFGVTYLSKRAMVQTIAPAEDDIWLDDLLQRLDEQADITNQTSMPVGSFNFRGKMQANLMTRIIRESTPDLCGVLADDALRFQLMVNIGYDRLERRQPGSVVQKPKVNAPNHLTFGSYYKAGHSHHSPGKVVPEIRKKTEAIAKATFKKHGITDLCLEKAQVAYGKKTGYTQPSIKDYDQPMAA